MADEIVLRIEIPKSLARGIAFGVGLLALGLPLALNAGQVQAQKTFSPGEVIRAADMNANFKSLQDAINDNDTRVTANATSIQANSNSIGSAATTASVNSNASGIGNLALLETVAKGNLVDAINETRGWTVLSNQTVATPASTLQVTGLASRYTEFEIQYVGTVSATALISLTINGDTTASNYQGVSWDYLSINGDGHEFWSSSVHVNVNAGGVTSHNGRFRITEGPLGASVSAGNQRSHGSGLVLNQSDIVSVQLNTGSTWAVGTRFVLLGR